MLSDELRPTKTGGSRTKGFQWYRFKISLYRINEPLREGSLSSIKTNDNDPNEPPQSDGKWAAAVAV
jgi:hypothetical protein